MTHDYQRDKATDCESAKNHEILNEKFMFSLYIKQLCNDKFINMSDANVYVLRMTIIY